MKRSLHTKAGTSDAMSLPEPSGGGLRAGVAKSDITTNEKGAAIHDVFGPDCPSDYSYRYLQAEKIGSNERTSTDAWNRRLVDKYLNNIHAMERLVVTQDDIATLQKHQAINAEFGAATIPAEVQGIRVGDCVLITSPVELLVEIGLDLKKASPHKHTLVVPFSNGYMYYGAPADAYSRGGYEVTECLLAPEWQRIYEQKAAEIMRRL